MFCQTASTQACLIPASSSRQSGNSCSTGKGYHSGPNASCAYSKAVGSKQGLTSRALTTYFVGCRQCVSPDSQHPGVSRYSQKKQAELEQMQHRQWMSTGTTSITCTVTGNNTCNQSLDSFSMWVAGSVFPQTASIRESPATAKRSRQSRNDGASGSSITRGERCQGSPQLVCCTNLQKGCM